MTTDDFAELFQGRLNAYGTDAGGCDKTDCQDGWEEALEYEGRIRRHLSGEAPMGVYPLRDDLTVSWGCTDLDYVEDPTDALNLATLLRAAGVNAWVEVSRSKGFHVWSFASEPIPALVMRHAFLAAHQMLEIPATEVNPKQVSLEGLKGYGNYVRLPYPGAMETGWTPNQRQQVFAINAFGMLPLHSFVDVALGTRSSLADYEKVAALYIAPPPPRQVTIDAEPEIDTSITKKLSRGGYLAFRYGPREGHDRSSSLMRLAYMAAEDGLTPAETLAVIRDLDVRLGKFVGRPDCEEQLVKMVNRAHG